MINSNHVSFDLVIILSEHLIGHNSWELCDAAWHYQDPATQYRARHCSFTQPNLFMTETS